VGLALLAPVSGQDAAKDPIDFSTQIEPLLAQNCHKCHGPDQQKGGLRLDRRDAALTAATRPTTSWSRARAARAT
jgi:mono/diheme cytochrome c family protein